MFHCDKGSVAVVKPSVEIEVTLFLVENSQSNKAAMPNDRLSALLFPFLFLGHVKRTRLQLISRRAQTLGLRRSRFQGDKDGGGWTAAPGVAFSACAL